MSNPMTAEKHVRESIRATCQGLNREDAKQQADLIAGDMAAQIYHYLIAVAHSELAMLGAKANA